MATQTETETIEETVPGVVDSGFYRPPGGRHMNAQAREQMIMSKSQHEWTDEEFAFMVQMQKHRESMPSVQDLDSTAAEDAIREATAPTLETTLHDTADELEIVWRDLGQTQPNRFVVAARTLLAKIAENSEQHTVFNCRACNSAKCELKGGPSQ
jgi:hypothetical protein